MSAHYPDHIPSLAAYKQMRREARQKKNDLIATLLQQGNKTQEQIATEANCHIKTVQRHRKALVERGLLQ